MLHSNHKFRVNQSESTLAANKGVKTKQNPQTIFAKRDLWELHWKWNHDWSFETFWGVWGSKGGRRERFGGKGE